MNTKPVTSTLDTTKPNHGEPVRVWRSNGFGNKRSRAAAYGIWPCNKIQPFNAPKVAARAQIVMMWPPVLPHITFAASLNGAPEAAALAEPSTPNTTNVPRMYTIAVTAVPKIVDHGIVRSGSRTSSAGTVADSNPMNDHKVSVAAAVTAP